MPQDGIQLNEGAGKILDDWKITKPIGDRHQEFVLLGLDPLPTYVITATNIAWTTTQRDLIQVMAGATFAVAIRWIYVTQLVAASAVTARSVQIFRLSTAGTGGTAITPRPSVTATTPAGATAMTKPTVNGTQVAGPLGQKASFVGTNAIPIQGRWEWVYGPGVQPLVIPLGTTQGIALTNPVSDAALTADIEIGISEINYVIGA